MVSKTSLSIWFNSFVVSASSSTALVVDVVAPTPPPPPPPPRVPPVGVGALMVAFIKALKFSSFSAATSKGEKTLSPWVAISFMSSFTTIKARSASSVVPVMDTTP